MTEHTYSDCHTTRENVRWRDDSRVVAIEPYDPSEPIRVHFQMHWDRRGPTDSKRLFIEPVIAGWEGPW